jgi:hypothetical protein
MGKKPARRIRFRTENSTGLSKRIQNPDLVQQIFCAHQDRKT